MEIGIQQQSQNVHKDKGTKITPVSRWPIEGPSGYLLLWFHLINIKPTEYCQDHKILCQPRKDQGLNYFTAESMRYFFGIFLIYTTYIYVYVWFI